MAEYNNITDCIFFIMRDYKEFRYWADSLDEENRKDINQKIVELIQSPAHNALQRVRDSVGRELIRTNKDDAASDRAYDKAIYAVLTIIDAELQRLTGGKINETS